VTKRVGRGRLDRVEKALARPVRTFFVWDGDGHAAVKIAARKARGEIADHDHVVKLRWLRGGEPPAGAAPTGDRDV
jgi:hypothetical protein